MVEKSEYRNEEWLREQYWEKGLSMLKVAQRAGVSEMTIFHWLKELGISTRRKITDTDKYWELKRKFKNKEWLQKQYLEKGFSVAEISRVFDVSGVTISRWLKEFGISARRSGRKLSVQNYQDMAERDNAVWIGEKVPGSNDGLTLWQCKKCGHQWKTTYRKLHLRNSRREREIDLMVLCVQCRHTRECTWCGGEFMASRQHEKYCCPDCKSKGHRRSLGLQQLLPGQPHSNCPPKICETCGETFFPRQDKVAKGQGRFCSLPCLGKWFSEDQRGENSPSWRGGISFEPYGLDFNEQLKHVVRERDGFTCQLCGMAQEQNGKALTVHHIDYDKTNNCMENLLSLCLSCHGKTNANREYWESLLTEYMKERKGPQEKLSSFRN